MAQIHAVVLTHLAMVAWSFRTGVGAFVAVNFVVDWFLHKSSGLKE